MSRRRVNNPLALAVLGCLTERPMHPYEISTTLRTRGKEHSIKLNYGSLYSVVGSLEKHGLITSRETVRDGRRPERTIYEITPEGSSEFEDWLAELISTPVRNYTSLEAGLSLMPGLPPAEVARLLEDRVVALRIELGGIAAAEQVADEMGLPEVFSVETRLPAGDARRRDRLRHRPSAADPLGKAGRHRGVAAHPRAAQRRDELRADHGRPGRQSRGRRRRSWSTLPRTNQSNEQNP